MAVRVTYMEIQNALDSSRKLGLGNTSLMLEGLAKQMHALEVASLYERDLTPKVDRIQKKIDCIRSSLDSEKEKDEYRKEYAWKKAIATTSEIFGIVAINGVGILGSFKLLEILQLSHMKSVAVATFAVIGAWQLSQTMIDAFSGHTELVGSIKKTLDNVERFLNETL